MQGATVSTSPGLVPPAAVKPAKVRKQVAKEDSEMRAMKRVDAAIAGLPQMTSLRVLRWALGRVEQRGYVEVSHQPTASGGDSRPLGGDQPR